MKDIPIFDIKTLTHEKNLFDQVDWELQEADMARMDQKYQDTEKLDRLTPEIDDMIEGFNLNNEMCITKNYVIQENLIGIPKSKQMVLRG
jgi:hypothetical protein